MMDTDRLRAAVEALLVTDPDCLDGGELTAVVAAASAVRGGWMRSRCGAPDVAESWPLGGRYRRRSRCSALPGAAPAGRGDGDRTRSGL